MEANNTFDVAQTFEYTGKLNQRNMHRSKKWRLYPRSKGFQKMHWAKQVTDVKSMANTQPSEA
jgi:hypothetical protein